MEFPSTIDQPPSFNSKLQLLAVALVTVTVLIFKLNILSPHRRRNLPPGSFGFPIFLGESLTFLKALKQNKLDSFFTDRITKHGPVFKTMLLGSKTVVLTGQAGNRFVFSGGDNGITSNLGVSARDILGKNSVFEISGARHKLVRGAMMNFLKPESLQRFVGEMDSVLKQQLSQSEFDVKFEDQYTKNAVDAIMAMRFRNFKHRCHLHYKKFSLEETRQHPPVNVEPLDWVPLCEHFKSKKFKDQSNVNKENRKDLEVNYTSGSKSFIQRLYEMKNSKTPPESSQLKLYKDTHQKKDGTWIDPRAEELHGKMEALKNQQTQEGNNNLTDDQIREEVLGSKIGYARGLGHGVKPCTSNS